MAKNVSNEMDEGPCLLKEDGYLNADTNVKEIIYHPLVNVILICTTDGTIHVLDVNSGVILLSSNLSARNSDGLTCRYIKGQDKVLFSDGQAIGVRSDYNGVLLLDSILQKTVTDSSERVKVELPFSEAVILKHSVTTSPIAGTEEFVKELTEVVNACQKQNKRGIKAQKWNTVCLDLPLSTFQSATNNIVSELVAKNRNNPELTIASAIYERLSELSGAVSILPDRKSMASESKRRETFSNWPHMDYKWALPDQMAQAGFYHQPNSAGDDRAMCFTCPVCLVCWEKTDEPWSEHERHSPNCPFVMGEYTQNVPLSVTLATNPAVDAGHQGALVNVLGTSTVPSLLPTSTTEGLISVFDVSGKISRKHSFYAKLFDSHILERLNKDFGTQGLWSNTDERKHPVVKKVTALSIVSEKLVKISSTDTAQKANLRPSIICGLYIKRFSDPKDQSPDSQPEPETNSKAYLIVYDFMYRKKSITNSEQKILPSLSTSKTDLPALDEKKMQNLIVDFEMDEMNYLTVKNLYKTFIPGESDEVFLPPLDLSSKRQGGSENETDSLFSIPTAYYNNCFPVLPENQNQESHYQHKCISDHIKDLKSAKNATKLNYSRAVQCVAIPNISEDFHVKNIIPTLDELHILVVVCSVVSEKSFLYIYGLDFTSDVVKISESPLVSRELALNEKPVEVSLLPPIDGAEANISNQIEGSVVTVCADGAVRIIQLSNLKVTSYTSIEGDNFISATYCNSLDRLCVSTQNGSLHFFTLNENDNESSEDHEEDELFGVSESTPCSETLEVNESTKCFYEPGSIQLRDLKQYYGLCRFEPLKTGYCAVVPPCWTEIQQGLRQRRHPQNIKIDTDQFTKTWRLQTDTTTWDEHIFEITWPSSTSLGHVDLHFALQNGSALPHVEVTLLRQNSSGIGHKRDVTFCVDDSITIDMLEWADNPVISKEYLRAHNADILAGPVNLAAHLNLAQQSGLITLTSPKLFKLKYRTLLVHIRAVYSKDDVGKKAGKRQRARNSEKLSSNQSKSEFYMGCDCIHELSITVYTCKVTELSHERSLRNNMLESNVFVRSLIQTVVSESSIEKINLSLDILNWIASIRLVRNRSNNGEAPNHQQDFIGILESSLFDILNSCVLLGGRCIAHKATKLIMTCCTGAKNINEQIGDHFYQSIMGHLHNIIEDVFRVRSASGLQWIFALLLKISSKDNELVLFERCVGLLNKVTEELNKRSNPYHLLLRSRYGLYGSPMESELFDVDPPQFSKNEDRTTNINPKEIFSNYETKIKYKNLTSNKLVKGLIEAEPLHFNCVGASEGTRVEKADILGGFTTKHLPISMAVAPFCSNKKDEIQQLINSCVEYSTFVQHYVKQNSIQDAGPSGCQWHYFPDKKPEEFAEALFQNISKSLENSAPKQTWQDDPSAQFDKTNTLFPWQQLLITPPQQVIVVERMQSGARRFVTLDFGRPVLLTDILIPSCNDLVVLSIDIWLKGEEIDETRLVVANDIGTRNLFLNDLQPPPLCRYLKITAVGRYGMSTTRCRIPTGFFYGHILILPEDIVDDSQQNYIIGNEELEKHLNVFSKLFEDISCRFSLSCSKLKQLLNPFLLANTKNTTNLFTYMNVLKDKGGAGVEHQKIFTAYEDVTNYQYQLNVIKNSMSRIELSLCKSDVGTQDSTVASTDKLKSIAETVLELLLCLDKTWDLDYEMCRSLFNGLCVAQSPRLQLLTAIFLDKACGRKSFWCDFLADTLFTMFATSYTQKFPQDRLFVLICYLSKKSSERSAMIDSALRVVAQILKPLDENQVGLLAVAVDLPLLSWMLMYLSIQLDMTINKSNKWNFVFGEMQERSSLNNNKNSSRKKCKRNQNNQMLAQTLPFYFPSKLGSAWKTHEILLKSDLVKDKFKYTSKKSSVSSADSSTPKEPSFEMFGEKVLLKKMPKFIDPGHYLIVAKSLLKLILAMDHSGSADMILLCFKVVARLSSLANLQLNQLLTEQQLLKLINFCILSNIPWVSFALNCFLQDLMEISNQEENEMETESTASTSWAGNEGDSLCETFVDENLLDSIFTKQEDSDLEELLEDFERVRRSVKKPVKSCHVISSISSAIDSRLEMGVGTATEVGLKKLVIENNEVLIQNLTADSASNETLEPNPWSIPTQEEDETNPVPKHKMLSNCFETLFKSFSSSVSGNIEPLISFWLSLNCHSKHVKFDPGTIPKIPLSVEAVNAVINSVASAPSLPFQTWCSTLQMLTLVCNINTGTGSTSQWSDISGMASCIVNYPQLVPVFINLLSGGRASISGGKALAGPAVCRALHDFLVRLQLRCDVVSPSSELGSKLKMVLMNVVYQLAAPSGPLAVRQGPLDAQCKLIQSMLYLDFTNTDVHTALDIFVRTARLVHSYMIAAEEIKCIGIGEKQSATTSTFSDIFASVYGSDSEKQEHQVSYKHLLITLLKLLSRVIETPVVEERAQTDESKAEQIEAQNSRCFADTILWHHPSIIDLFHALTACKTSSLSMLANVSQKVDFNFGEPSTVGDAVFHVLTSLAKKSSNKELIIRPLLMFLSNTPPLSEPLLWYILQVIDTPEALSCFMEQGGIRVLAESIVVSSNHPNRISKVGMISAIMQHFNGVCPPSDASSFIVAASPAKKLLQANIENKMSLINFAPYCVIWSKSGTAQQADILLQGVGNVTHRRARAPLWSYQFYPDEVHTDLTLQFPSAVLLKEVQLQPHSTSLVTAPSAVALEASPNGPSRLVPICSPIPTSGLNYIRLVLPSPKVVDYLLIRLYRPRDSASVGLLQIRLLGHSAYGGSMNDSDGYEDDSHCNHSLGWLRLLHHCFTLPRENDLAKEVIESASRVENLLKTCCGLLLVPSHVLYVYLPSLEKVLKELALLTRENSFEAIKVLLDNSSSAIEPFTSDTAWQDRFMINNTNYLSACELLYQICEHQDESTCDRVRMILDWLEKALASGNCNPSYISIIASILWFAKQRRVSYGLEFLSRSELFQSAYKLRTNAEDEFLKSALDSLLCSLCYINPAFYSSLLRKICFNTDSMTDDHKINNDQYNASGNLNISHDQLRTLALVSRSPPAIEEFLNSGLPLMLNKTIMEFCLLNEEALTKGYLENVTAILKFFTDISDDQRMRDWLGSSEGSSFWLDLLHWLCKKPLKRKTSLPSEARVQLEEVCVKFLSKCCLCHHVNQTRLAKVLCKVISMQSNGISGFLRRLILQLLLENEKIPVSIVAEETLYKNSNVGQFYLPQHPGLKQSYNKAMLYLNVNTKLVDILEQHVYFNTLYKTEPPPKKQSTSMSKRESLKSWFVEDLSMAAGVTAKDKRVKDAKNLTTPQFKKKRYSVSDTSGGDSIGGRGIRCDMLPQQTLPLSMTLSQLLMLTESRGVAMDWPCLHLTICNGKGSEDKAVNSEVNSALQQHQFNSALQIFSSMGGLVLLAEHLPIVYPEAIRLAQNDKNNLDQSDSEWIKVDDCDDIYEDIEDTVGTNSSSTASRLMLQVPPHSLTAFGLFLRLPGYAEVLLKDMKRAVCLLRLVLGVTDDDEGGDIFQSPVADSLPTLPFEILRNLYSSTPLGTDDGRLLRRISVNAGVIHLLLICLSVFSHHSPEGAEKDPQVSKGKEERAQHYWAKGTGFGTGSTQQSWNVEQALLKQRSEEEHVTVILQVLAMYINPSDSNSEEGGEEMLPSNFLEVLMKSSLLAALSTYLKNDSVLDMARHIPLYKAVLKLIRAVASSSQLVSLLLPQKDRGESIGSLLRNMKTCVDTYASKLNLNSVKNPKQKSKLGEQLEEMDSGEGLATLMPDIQETTNLVAKYTNDFLDCDLENDNDNCNEKKSISRDERYVKVMKPLQFGSYEMISEQSDGEIKFIISHHFESNAKSVGEQSHPARVKRIAQEAVTLSTSLPLSYSSSVFVRYDTSRLDLMKVLIIGPSDTPYSNGCFEFDVFFPNDYPVSPMLINLETTGHHSVRFNPNLYNDGKVCLSILNTWHGRPEEKWNAQTSSFLQVLVSIQSLILVPEPYFNEPGYERARGTPAGSQSSKDYNLTICQATVRWAMLEQILHPCPCFKEVINAHFYLKRDEILAQVEEWIKEVEVDVNKEKKSRGNKKSPTSTLDTFKKVYQQLKEELFKLKAPGGSEDVQTAGASSDNLLSDNSDENSEDVDMMEKMVSVVCD